MRSKTIIIILVTLLTLALAAVAFLIGMMLASDKKTPPAQPAVMESAAEISTEALTTDAGTTTSTEAATTVTTAAETTAAATTTALAKPTITNAYMFYHNTGAGCKLYLHVEGDYAKYQYQVYIKSPADTQYSVTNKGESKETEFLVAEGLSDFGIESYKASITAWNADKSESVEQWAYMNNAACEDDTAAAVKHGAHLFGGYVDTKSDNLNLRAKPNTNAKTLAKIPQGVSLTFTIPAFPAGTGQNLTEKADMSAQNISRKLNRMIRLHTAIREMIIMNRRIFLPAGCTEPVISVPRTVPFICMIP